MNVVVFAAHPDDEILGAGATLAAHARAGGNVHAVVIADGATSRYADGTEELLYKEGHRAASLIGFASIRFLSLPDQRLDTLPLVEVTQSMEALLDELRPEIVYTHCSSDVNADHGVVARAAWTACRPYRLPSLRRFVAFETPSSTEWAGPGSVGRFNPNLYADISETLEAKIAAMECYETELREYPHPRSSRALRERAAYWGSTVGLNVAEPFQLLREIVR
jgi:LmbE family N-acetylglucosaminyl deacetylase